MTKSENRDSRDLIGGNTKPQSNQLTMLTFTWNNYDKEKFKLLETTFKNFCRKARVQSEVGLECGTPHLHGIIWFKINPKTNKPYRHRWNELNLPNSIHWEKVKNEASCLDYCRKSGPDGFDGVYEWEFGLPQPLKCLNILKPWQAYCEEYCLKEPDGQTVFWIYDKIGGEGKSSFCRYMTIKHNTLVIQGGKLADIMNIIFNTDMDDVSSILIDIPRCNKNKVSYASIECILNGMITNTKYETGRKIFNPPNIIIFSNFAPEVSDETLSMRRWKIKELYEGQLNDFDAGADNDF